jgi:hypothetical protein
MHLARFGREFMSAVGGEIGGRCNKKQPRLRYLDECTHADMLGDGGHMWIGYPGYLTQVLTNLLYNIECYAYPDGKEARLN